MDDPEEHALVAKALSEGLGGCVEWDEKSADHVRNDPDLQGLRPLYIRAELIQYVKAQGGQVVQQVKEKRDHWRDLYAFYYKVILPIGGFKHGLFVEMRLTGDDDPDYPEVTLVGAHPQRK
jgi:hypothetical protein